MYILFFFYKISFFLMVCNNISMNITKREIYCFILYIYIYIYYKIYKIKNYINYNYIKYLYNFIKCIYKVNIKFYIIFLQLFICIRFNALIKITKAVESQKFQQRQLF